MTQFPRTAHLTDAAIGRLPASPHRVTIRDAKLSQLALSIGPRSRTWYLHATVLQLTRRVHLGRFPVVSTDEARQRALEALRRLYAGEDLQARHEAGLTLRAALARYLEARRLKPRSVDDCRGVIERHAASWLDQPVRGIKAQHIATRYRETAARSVSAANKLMRNLGAVLRYASVAHGACAPDTVQRARVLLGGVEALAAKDNTIPEAKQRAWFQAIERLAPDVRGLLLALALTGCRRNELRGAQRSAWDDEARVLRIQETKSGKPHTLPVGRYLGRLLDDRATGVKFFDLQIHEARTAYDAVGRAIGHPFTLHDLRRTFATTATRLGIDEVTVKRLLNHAPSGVTQTHYIRLTVDDLRDPMQRIEDYFLAQWGA